MKYRETRVITELEEQIYRLRHHDFDGMTVAEIARQIKMNRGRIRWILRNLKAKAPQLFPILTHHQHLIYWLYVERGLTQQRIADYLGIASSNICTTLGVIRKKGILVLKPKGHRNDLSYEGKLDENIIIYKF